MCVTGGLQGVRGVEFVLGDLLRIAGGDEEEVDSMVGDAWW